MNKIIYNNLKLDNLMKSDWIKSFGEKQQYEIRAGYEKELDITIYARKEYSWQKMKEIRKGLEKKIRCFFLFR